LFRVFWLSVYLLYMRLSREEIISTNWFIKTVDWMSFKFGWWCSFWATDELIMLWKSMDKVKVKICGQNLYVLFTTGPQD